jgi:hypothetical protein
MTSQFGEQAKLRVALVVPAMVSGIRLHYIFIIYSSNIHLRDGGVLAKLSLNDGQEAIPTTGPTFSTA